MQKIDQTILEDFGLDKLPPQFQEAAIHDIYETLQKRVGMKLAAEMTAEQLNTFENLKNKDDEATFNTWLEQTFPNYPEVVASELQGLKDEARANAAAIQEARGKSDSVS